MKKRRFWVIIMVAVMVLVGGCGNKETDATTDTTSESHSEASPVESSAENSGTETVESSVESQSQEEIATSPEPVDVNSLITEKTDEELDLKKYPESYEDRTMDNEGEKVFSLELFEKETDDDGLLTATGNIDIYNINGIRVGYMVSKARFDIFGEYEGWYYFYLDENRRFARVKDVDANIKTNKQIAEEKEAEEARRQEQSSDVNPNPIQNVPVEQPVEAPMEAPVETNDYTAEQAIADYRAIMEANGITFDPSIKEFASWGTGMLPLNKAEVEAAAYSSVESFAVGDSVGHPWTLYYLEVTGSDENYVYVTEYCCTN